MELTETGQASQKQEKSKNRTIDLPKIQKGEPYKMTNIKYQLCSILLKLCTAQQN